MNVMLSCTTKDQLYSAERYSMLAHLRIAREDGLDTVKEVDFVRLVQRSIGYSLCKIVNNEG